MGRPRKVVVDKESTPVIQAKPESTPEVVAGLGEKLFECPDGHVIVGQKSASYTVCRVCGINARTKR